MKSKKAVCPVPVASSIEPPTQAHDGRQADRLSRIRGASPKPFSRSPQRQIGSRADEARVAQEASRASRAHREDRGARAGALDVSRRAW